MARSPRSVHPGRNGLRQAAGPPRSRGQLVIRMILILAAALMAQFMVVSPMLFRLRRRLHLGRRLSVRAQRPFSGSALLISRHRWPLCLQEIVLRSVPESSAPKGVVPHSVSSETASRLYDAAVEAARIHESTIADHILDGQSPVDAVGQSALPRGTRPQKGCSEI